MRKLSPVELALVISVGGCVLAVMIPVFHRNLRVSRFVEPLEGLQHITSQAAALAIARAPDGPFPDSVERTPAEVPHAEAVADAPGTWDNPTWRALGFEQPAAHYYSFTFHSRVRGPSVQFTAIAQGDLDGDGDLSTFSQSGEASSGGEAVIEPVYMYREVE